MKIGRRGFMQGCCAGIIAMSGSRIGNVVFGQGATGRDIVITVFLRGGMDALSFLVPTSTATDASAYATGRGRLALNAGQVLGLGADFGLHPSATGLKSLYDQQKLAVISACGSPDPTRSHFEAQDYMDRGVPGPSGYNAGGWLARYLQTTPGNAVFKGVSQGAALSLQFEGYEGALALNGADGFSIEGSSTDDVRRSLRTMYAGDADLGEIAVRTLDAVDTIDFAAPGTYVPSPGVTYPANNSLATSLSAIAQMIKLDLGLEAASVDFGGWDTHENQCDYNNPTIGTYANLVGNLSGALKAFWDDLASVQNRLTIVVMSEFGRRLKANDDVGTDHGHAGTMMVINNSIQQKKVWGVWPGLDTADLFEQVDLQVTTDFRQVLSEIMIARCGFTSLTQLFPGYAYPGPVGIFGTAGQLPLMSDGMYVR